MHYRAVITDLDGTALDSPKEKVASTRLATAVKALEAVGIKVCAATGRAESFALPVLDDMGLTQPAIIASGTRIIDPVSRQELWRCGLTEQQTRKLVKKLKYTSYGFLWNDSTADDYLSGAWPLTNFTAYDDTYFLEACFVPVNEVAALEQLIKSVEGVTVTIVVAQRPGLKDIHITNAAATKEHAIYELEKMIGVPKDQMIGVGDGHNDLHIFNAVGHKVAMANAVTELKAAADQIIGSVTEDGLAIYFEQLAKEAKT